MERLDEWRLFAAVAGLQSFGRAARQLGRSPQAATRAVSALEARVGVRLLQRTTRAVSLTEEGARYLERARAVLARFDELERPETDAPPRGTLSLTAPVLFGQLHVVPIVAAFLATFPAVNVRLLLLDRPVSLLEEGVDLAIRIGPLPDSSLRARLVGTVRSVLCASPAYLAHHPAPRRPEDLARHQAIAFTATTPLPDRWVFPSPAGRARTVIISPRLVVNTGQAAIDAALTGLGVARLLSYQVSAQLADGSLRALLPRFEPPPLPVHLLQPAGAPVRNASLFANLAVERLRPVLAP